MPNSSWNIRINRAIELIKSQSAASELLQFYQQLARFQESVFEQLPSAEDHDVSVLVPFIAGLSLHGGATWFDSVEGRG